MKQTLQELLKEYPAWKQVENTLVGNWTCDTFAQVQLIVSDLMQIADELDHHPTVTFGYNTIQVETTTHDVEHTVTEKDVELAKRIGQIVK